MKTIIAIIALAAVLFAGAYIVSDPFRTKVNTFFESATTWTDENIADDAEARAQRFRMARDAANEGRETFERLLREATGG